MQPPKPPKATAVEVIPAQPTEAESAAIAHLSAETDKAMPQAVHVVKVRLKSKPEATSMAWALYVGDALIPKYWEDDDGIYFTVLDPQFLTEHKGQRLRFSHDGVDFVDTGVKLPAPTAVAKGKRKVVRGKQKAVKGKRTAAKRTAAKGKRKAAKGKKAK